MADKDNNTGSDNNANSKTGSADSSSVEKLLQHDKIVIGEDVQQMLNNPTEHAAQLDPKDQAFLAMLMEKVERGGIDLLKPSSLLNMAVYEKLDEKAQGKADFDAVNLLAAIREIRNLWNAGNRDTYQIENAVHRIRVTKERLEELGGDVFVI